MVGQAVHSVLVSFLPWFILILVVPVLVKAFLPRIKGWVGESRVNSHLREKLDPAVYHLIPDIMLPTEDGTTQIDHVIVSRYGIFVVETKNYTGWIFGSERDAQWTQQIYKRKERFQNPLRQNYKHTKTLSELTGIPGEYFKSVVVFAGDATFKTEMPANVVHARDCASCICRFSTPMIKDDQVLEVATAIREWAATVTAKQKQNHVAHVREKKATVGVMSSVPVCSTCGANMVLRKSRANGNQFWGCSTYPKCKQIVAIG